MADMFRRYDGAVSPGADSLRAPPPGGAKLGLSDLRSYFLALPTRESISSTFFHSDGLLLGASLALLASERLLPSKFATSRRLPWLALGIIIAMMLAGYGSLPYGWAIMTPITVAATALVIASVTSGSASPLSRSLSVKPLLWIGKRSYGIYLWHATILWIIAATPLYGSHVYLADVFVVALTFGAAAASYALIERPALRSEGA